MGAPLISGAGAPARVPGGVTEGAPCHHASYQRKLDAVVWREPCRPSALVALRVGSSIAAE
eukprot:14694878-Alexandrium_andersonii.AAC.1